MPGELGFTSLFLGTTSLYTYVRPPFLGRNQRSILREFKLEVEQGPEAHRKRMTAMRNGTLTTRNTFRDWRSVEEVRAATSEARLVVSLTTIERCWRERLSPHVTGSRVQRLSCVVYCSIYHTDDLQNPLAMLKKKATLVSLADNDPNVDIILDGGPFSFNESDLSPDISARAYDTDGKIVSRDEGQLSARLQLVCQDHEQRRILYKLLDPSVSADLEHSSGRSGMHVGFRLTSDSPPQLELCLNVSLRGETIGLESKLHFTHEWQESSLSTLEVLQQSTRQGAQGSASFPPTDEMELDTAAEPDYEVTYVFTGQAKQRRCIKRQDVHCGICDWQNHEKAYDNLHFHLVNNHNHFKITESKTKGVSTGATKRRTIMIDLKQEDRQAKKDFYKSSAVNFSWIRPTKPFDMRKYLQGDKSWVAAGLGATVVKDKTASDTSREAHVPPALTFTRPLSPSQVQPVQPRKKQRWCVPHIPGVELYRTATKRRLEPGELLSESEEDSDDDWASQRQRLQASSLPGASGGEFFVLFDSHVRREALSSDRHLQESVVRFCRRHRLQLARPLVFADLKLKLRQLRMTKLMAPEYEQYCLELVGSAVEAGAGKVDAMLARKKIRAGQCVCGEVAEGGLRTVWCSSDRCVHEAFHMACIGMQKLDRSWQCSDCSRQETS